MTTSHVSARPAKPGIWIALLFVFFCGMTFSSSAEERSVRAAGAAIGSSDSALSLVEAAVPMPTWTLFSDNDAGESASLAFLGFALIGAAGCWRRVIRRRTSQRSNVTVARRPQLRAVSRLATSD